jgi:hypothetical protein
MSLRRPDADTVRSRSAVLVYQVARRCCKLPVMSSTTVTGFHGATARTVVGRVGCVEERPGVFATIPSRGSAEFTAWSQNHVQ